VFIIFTTREDAMICFIVKNRKLSEVRTNACYFYSKLQIILIIHDPKGRWCRRFYYLSSQKVAASKYFKIFRVKQKKLSS